MGGHDCTLPTSPHLALPLSCSPALQVKGAMKRAPAGAKVLQRCLNARQFGLKLIANVTYGYTAAGFSGGWWGCGRAQLQLPLLMYSACFPHGRAA